MHSFTCSIRPIRIWRLFLRLRLPTNWRWRELGWYWSEIELALARVGQALPVHLSAPDSLTSSTDSFYLCAKGSTPAAPTNALIHQTLWPSSTSGW
jgi:hypothetical protein